MLGVLDDYRSAGLGRALKLLQRERALAMGARPDRMDLRSAPGAERASQLLKARHCRRGGPGKHLRRVHEPVAPRQPDRSFRRAVVDSAPARRTTAGRGRDGGWRLRHPHDARARVVRFAQGESRQRNAGVRRCRSVARLAKRVARGEFRSASPRCSRPGRSLRWRGASPRARSSRPIFRRGYQRRRLFRSIRPNGRARTCSSVSPKRR